MARVIALYLPQYHPIPENDEWWGPGFTEWVNVAQARPLFRGHKQPHIPADLGFYDLRNPEIREAQAKLAQDAGIEGFCYWHYWFGNGKQLLESPFNEVVESGKPDFPFCLGWANHSWYKKMWGRDQSKDKIIIEITYPGEEDHIAHFYSLLKAFKDDRYIKVNGKLFFLIYKPLEIPNVSEFLLLWRRLAKENGISDFYFVGETYSEEKSRDEILKLGFDAIYSANMMRVHNRNFILFKVIKRVIGNIFRRGVIYKYSNAMKYFNTEEAKDIDRVPGIYANWDHSPRSNYKCYILSGYTPELFYKHVVEALDYAKEKPKENQVFLLQSWNEWGEGNYLEPDREYGKEILYAIKKAINRFDKLQKENFKINSDTGVL